MEVISTNKAPKVVGPYSQGVISNGLVFCAGQIGLNPKTNELEEGIENQTKQIMSNISAVLEQAGTDLTHVVKTTIFLANMNDYATVNELYGSFFPETKPARSAIQVAKLPKDALIEIEVIAELL